MNASTLTEKARIAPNHVGRSGAPDRLPGARRSAAAAAQPHGPGHRPRDTRLHSAVHPAAQPTGSAGGLGDGAAIVTSLRAISLLSVVYMNLVTALVARREELVLKRLCTGELSDAEIIAGTAAPAVALAWGQVSIGVLAALTVFGMGVPTNTVLVLAAIILGTTVFACWRWSLPRSHAPSRWLG